MANGELVRTLDYILNRCDEVSIDAVAQAVVRRRRELTMFGGKSRLPNAAEMAKTVSARINAGASIEGMRKTVLDMAVRIIKKEAPELNDEQIASLTAAWIPGASKEKAAPEPELLVTMVNQFTAFSRGMMDENEDKKLREELGAWPERYWKAFPEGVKLLIRDFLSGETDENGFSGRLRAALSLENP